MHLDKQQHDKFSKYVAEKWKPPYQCGCCKANNWSISDRVFQLAEFSPSGIVIGGPVVPLAPVTCNNCGNTILLNAIIAGVVEQNKEEAPKNE